jgi:arylsulfatase A-like enzyme
MRTTCSIAGLAALALLAGPAPAAEKPPHVVFLLADDLGWKNVGYHGSEVKTPNLDRLSAAGVRLEQFYVLPVCSPTRAALLTGRYPMRYGLQSGVVRPWSKHGLPVAERTLPQALKGAGYRTAITGKWYLGDSRPAYLPTRRGFDHQYGHYTGAIDYFQHTRDGGLDWHRDDKALREEGYSTQLIAREAVRLINAHDPAKPLFLYVPFNAPHAPPQALPEYLARYKHIKNTQKRTYAALVACLDDAVGEVAAALRKKGLSADTLLIFSSDNGGPVRQGADNGPLRAAKGTLYEGGVRVPAWASWPGKLKPGVVKAPLHMVDWYPTLLKLAGVSLRQKFPLDGRDAWPALAGGKPSPHEEILLNVEPHRGALRRGDWKLVFHGQLPRPAGARGSEGAELFNLADDPFEKTNRAGKEPKRAEELLRRLDRYAKEAVPPLGGAKDARPAGWKAPAVYGEKEMSSGKGNSALDSGRDRS